MTRRCLDRPSPHIQQVRRARTCPPASLDSPTTTTPDGFARGGFIDEHNGATTTAASTTTAGGFIDVLAAAHASASAEGGRDRGDSGDGGVPAAATGGVGAVPDTGAGEHATAMSSGNEVTMIGAVTVAEGPPAGGMKTVTSAPANLAGGPTNLAGGVTTLTSRRGRINEDVELGDGGGSTVRLRPAGGADDDSGDSSDDEDDKKSDPRPRYRRDHAEIGGWWGRGSPVCARRSGSRGLLHYMRACPRLLRPACAVGLRCMRECSAAPLLAALAYGISRRRTGMSRLRRTLRRMLRADTVAEEARLHSRLVAEIFAEIFAEI